MSDDYLREIEVTAKFELTVTCLVGPVDVDNTDGTLPTLEALKEQIEDHVWGWVERNIKNGHGFLEVENIEGIASNFLESINKQMELENE